MGIEMIICDRDDPNSYEAVILQLENQHEYWQFSSRPRFDGHQFPSPARPASAPAVLRGKTIAVIGSSVAAGWVTSREAAQDMKNGWAFRLARHLEPFGYKVVNRSVPGDTTEKVLARLDKDLLSIQPDIAVISLSLENEGIRGIGGRDPRKVYENFATNLRRIIDECRKHKIMPVVASCYANDNFGDPATYRFILDMNLEMASWGVPVVNFMGALDRGDGRFVKGLTFDLDHPADRGHRELFLSIVPGLFAALTAGKSAPEWDSQPGSFSTEQQAETDSCFVFPRIPCIPSPPCLKSGPAVQASLPRFLEKTGNFISFPSRRMAMRFSAPRPVWCSGFPRLSGTEIGTGSDGCIII